MSSVSSSKICGICHEDCSNRPRTKDASGHYYCRACYDKALAAKHAGDGHSHTGETHAMIAPAHAKPAEAKSNARRSGHDVPPPDEGEFNILEDLVTEPAAAEAPPETAKACPKCGARMAMEATMCMSCGFNQHAGHSIMPKTPRAAAAAAAASLIQASTIAALVAAAALSVGWYMFFLQARSDDIMLMAYLGALFVHAVVYHVWAIFAAGRIDGSTQFLVWAVPGYFVYFVFALHKGKALKSVTVPYLLAVVLFVVLGVNGGFARLDRAAARSNQAGGPPPRLPGRP